MGAYLQTLAQRSAYPQQYADYDTQYGGIKEAIGWSWYDTLAYTSAATTILTFFNAVRATLNIGNMEQAGALASPKAFFLRAIRVKYNARPYATSAAATANPQTGAVDDMVQLSDQGIAQLTIGQKIYGQWPIWMLVAGGGVVSNGTYPIAQYGTMGAPDARSVYTLSKPLFIAPLINFKVDLLWPGGAVTLAAGNNNLVVILDGDLVRPVQ